MPLWRVFDRRDEIQVTGETVPEAGTRLDLRVHYERLRITSERHEYLLVVEIENIGLTRVENYRVDIRFPKIFLDIESYGCEIHKAETDTHKLFRRTAAQFPDDATGLYPGEVLVDKLIKYSVNGQRYSSTWMDLAVEVFVFAENMPRHQVRKPVREIQNF